MNGAYLGGMSPLPRAPLLDAVIFSMAAASCLSRVAIWRSSNACALIASVTAALLSMAWGCGAGSKRAVCICLAILWIEATTSRCSLASLVR